MRVKTQCRDEKKKSLFRQLMIKKSAPLLLHVLKAVSKTDRRLRRRAGVIGWFELKQRKKEQLTH